MNILTNNYSQEANSLSKYELRNSQDNLRGDLGAGSEHEDKKKRRLKVILHSLPNVYFYAAKPSQHRFLNFFKSI